ncbi:STAS domain-containing protein [Nonomuraea sp. FMUSA5-5]|uniref:STAS domain-containing protein n=1 Tax=Nonomuraea composti TaxID=2720023 RepID=A0ABX1BH14_9ACTN|nr:STAS domain-containing protein [Nonomuraea sp. FMUSA5-5]NJP94123.1 STAS domain-containing protein [Nonomuraea sp. FMUSA5-5]
MMQLSVRLVPVDDTTLVIALTGELDSTTKPVLAAFLDPLPQTTVKHVLVAGGDLWFCDLNGLDLLARTHRALQEKGGHLALAEVQPPLRRLIALMTEQSAATIPVFATMPEALAAAGVEAYQPAEPALRRRHLPRLRTVPRAPSAARAQARSRREPAPAQAAQAARPRAAEIELDVSSLPSVIFEARSLRDQALHQQQALNNQLTAAAQARAQLLTTRRRCDDSLMAMRSSLSEARSILTLAEASQERPHLS